jgi:CubicO group peptidase (beta-lactamase class C family)
MRALDTALATVRDWPVDAAAVAVLDTGGVVARVGPDEPMRWASVTKLVTALAVLIAAERGDVSLDEPAGPPGATVRHLLAHASGMGPEDDAPLAAPGKRRIYSNRGFEVLGDLVSARVGKPFPGYVTAEVLEQLGMTGTRLTGSPAHGISGPLRDLAALGAELLVPTLAAGLRAEATRVAFPGLPGVLPGFGRQSPNDWGLGFELRDGKSPHWTGSTNSPATFGHFGQSGSFLWVDPEAGLACACLTGTPFGEWAATHWPRLSDLVLAETGMSRPATG